MRRLALMMLLVASCAGAVELPDSVSEWRCVNEQITPLVLDANGETLGRIVYRDYEREAPRGFVQMILTEGRGTGSLYVPERVRDSEGVMPSDSGYKTLSVSGHRAVLEEHSYMPLALAVDAGENLTLTLESSSLSEQELLSFAEEVLSSWSSTD